MSLEVILERRYPRIAKLARLIGTSTVLLVDELREFIEKEAGKPQ